jgi:tetratricopeptide (TPR) repeat protein
MYFTLRVSGFEPVQVKQQVVGNDVETDIRQLCRQLAESLLGITDPYRLAVVCYREKRYNQAVEWARKIIKERPYERTWGYLAWGSVLEEQGQHELAMSKYQRATELDSTFGFAWRRWSSCLSRQKNILKRLIKLSDPCVTTLMMPKHGPVYPLYITGQVKPKRVLLP